MINHDFDMKKKKEYAIWLKEGRSFTWMWDGEKVSMWYGKKTEKKGSRILLKNNNTLTGKTVNYLIILFLYKLKEIRSDLQQQIILEGPCLVHQKRGPY